MPNRAKETPTRHQQRRKYVRFALKNKVRFQIISGANHRPAKGSSKKLCGIMLNISQGGMLLLTSAEIGSTVFLALSLEVPGLSQVSNVIGKVKRVEKDKRKYLVGIEFCELADFYSSTSIQNCVALPKNLGTFRNKIREVLLRQEISAVI